jgi:hypothetical protein
MPTPFTHLEMSLRLLADPLVPAGIRDALESYRPDFLLGAIIADARPESGKRADTHFYEYTKPMPDSAWREMFRQHPSIKAPQSDAHRAFLAAYVAHLSADEYWTTYLLQPHIAMAVWGDGLRDRFYMLHFILIHMDERDEKSLPSSVPSSLRQSEPQNWLPFLGDNLIRNWRDYIAKQLESESDTLNVFGARIETPAERMRQLIDDADWMQSRLWQHISPALLSETEAKMYEFSRQQLLNYWNEFLSL